MHFNQFQTVEGDFEKDGLFITYEVTYAWDMIKDSIEIDSIDNVGILDAATDEDLESYYDNNKEIVDSWIKEDAKKLESQIEWETPSYSDYLEAKAEFDKYE